MGLPTPDLHEGVLLKEEAIMRTFLCVILIVIPTAAFAGDEPTPMQWWQIVSGILAIPMTMGTLIFGLATLKKTRLESRKIELELREREAAIAGMPGATSAHVQEIAHSLLNPLIDNNRVNYLMLRFVIVYLVLQFWGVFEKLWDLLSAGTLVTLQQVFNLRTDGVPIMIFVALNGVVQFGWIALVLLLVPPLYRDISHHIGFDIWEKFGKGSRDPKREARGHS